MSQPDLPAIQVDWGEMLTESSVADEPTARQALKTFSMIFVAWQYAIIGPRLEDKRGFMTVSLGISYVPGQWRVCRVEQGQLAESHLFGSADEMLAVARQLCAQYPEPTIVLALDVVTPFVALPTLSDEQLERLVQRYHPGPAFSEVKMALQALGALSLRSYCAPSVAYLSGVPLHRCLMRPALGSASEVCAVVALLHYMRRQEATWEEMNFFYVNAGENGTCVLVIVNGQVVNGIETLQGSSLSAAYSYLAQLEGAEGLKDGEREERAALQAALDEAFWEGLKQELAGLLALEHSEDMVVLGSQSARLIERLADTYQIYLFPHAHTEREGYESALGAALLGEGLEQEGDSAAVVNRLQICQANRVRLAPVGEE